MVCLACLLPLFLVPIVNLLPVLFHFILGKVYRLFGREYQKPERAPAACPMKPATAKTHNQGGHDPGSVASAASVEKVVSELHDDKKID